MLKRVGTKERVRRSDGRVRREVKGGRMLGERSRKEQAKGGGSVQCKNGGNRTLIAEEKPPNCCQEGKKPCGEERAPTSEIQEKGGEGQTEGCRREAREVGRATIFHDGGRTILEKGGRARRLFGAKSQGLNSLNWDWSAKREKDSERFLKGTRGKKKPKRQVAPVRRHLNENCFT